MSERTIRHSGWLGGAVAALAAVLVILITGWTGEFFLFWKWFARN